MTHAVRIRKGEAAYCNRWVETARLREERAAGYPAAEKFGDMRGVFGVLHILLGALKKRLGVLDPSNGLGTANTALAFHAGRLLALHEGDKPYWLRLACDGMVSTVGRLAFGGKIDHPITAHPKIDPVTGEMFAFGYSVNNPYLWYSRFDAGGGLVADFPVPLPEAVMLHDFALTQRHVIFLDVPLLFKPDAMLKKGTVPFEFNAARATRFGVLDRYAADASGIKWFSVDPCMIFHVANAWETDPEGRRLELYVCAFKSFSLDDFTRKGADSDPFLSRVTLDLDTGEATMMKLSPIPGDFPVVPAALVGRPTRFTYVASFEPSLSGPPTFDSVAKIDLAAAGPETAVAGMVRHGGGLTGGEAFFVPHPGGAEEDDGYLMTIVTDVAAVASDLVIYDAKSMSSTPVARVKLPQRVPSGFHCTWVTEQQIKGQRGGGELE